MSKRARRTLPILPMESPHQPISAAERILPARGDAFGEAQIASLNAGRDLARLGRIVSDTVVICGTRAGDADMPPAPRED